MSKSATDVMQEILFSAVIDSIAALKTASKGMPNTLLRDINTVHPNTTFADLPAELQAAITTSVRTAFKQLQKEGYTVTDAKLSPPPRGPAKPATGDRGRPSPRPSGQRPQGQRPRRPTRPPR